MIRAPRYRVFLSVALLSATPFLARCSGTPAPATPAPVGAVATAGPAGLGGDTPDFKALPLIEWGDAPAGTPHAERQRTYDLRHQIIRVRFDWSRHAVVGTTTLRVAALDTPLRDVAIDGVDMTIRSVKDEGGRTLRYDYNDSTLVVHLPTAVAPGAETSVVVDYETVRPKQGVYFIDRVHDLWTQGETEATRYWVPTYDYPNDKTTWEMYITTAANEKALSNGRLAGTRDVAGGKEWHWVLEHPASTYLMSVVTGDYTIVEDRWQDKPVNYWTYPDSVAAARRGFGKTPQAIEVFSRLTGVPYPWSKYDQSVAPDYIFGGMENVTATTQLDDGILHPAWAETEANADGLMSHELGHQWYGDLLTTETWAHIWLNEGFATFMQETFTEADKGRDASQLDRRGAQRQVIGADRRARRPLVYDRWVTDPFELFFSGHIYPKGATVLQMLRHQLGDSTFWAAMHRYTTDHMYQPVVSADLEHAFEQETGRDFSRFFRQWVYGAGMPVFRVGATYDAGSRRLTLQARQVQPRDSMTGFFDTPVDVKVMTDAGVVRRTVQVSGETTTATIDLPAAPRAIVWDAGGWVLDITDFPRPTSMLVYQLQHDDDVMGRMEAIDVLAERTDNADAAAALAAAARGDAFWGVRSHAADALAGFEGNAAARAALLEASRDQDARVRNSAAGDLAGFHDDEVAARLLEMTRSDPSFYVRGAAINSYTPMVSAEQGLAAGKAMLALDTWRDIARANAVGAISQLDSPEVWDILVSYLRPGTSRNARTTAIGALAARARARSRQAEAARAIEPLLDTDDVFVRQSAANALGRLGQTSSLSALRARAATEAESRVKNSILAAIRAIEGAGQ